MLAVDAAMRVEAAALRMRIDGTNSQLTCRIDAGPRTLVGVLLRGRSILALVRATAPLLVRAGVRIDVRIGSLVIGHVGRGVRANAPARLLRLPATHLG